MAKDPVCGMECDPRNSQYKVDFQGQTYCFCSQGCKEAFEKEPQRYTSKLGTRS